MQAHDERARAPCRLPENTRKNSECHRRRHCCPPPTRFTAILPVQDQEHCRAKGPQIFPCRFRCTCKTAMAAGVMPEMRAAWPRERGLMLSSFSTTSLDRPGRPR